MHHNKGNCFVCIILLELRKRVKRLVREIRAARRKTQHDGYAIKSSTVGAKHANSFASDITKS